MKTFGCIIYNPDNVPLRKNDLESVYKNNNHGLGLYVWDKEAQDIIIKKWEAFVPFDTIWPTIEEINNNPARYTNFAINMRFATSGLRTKNQTHPIRVFERQMYLMHHGSYLGFEWKPSYLSDTQCIADWLQNFMLENDCKSLEDLMANPMCIELIEDKFGGNRLLLLEKDKGLILKKEMWQQDIDGVWWTQLQ